jgi:hypothetical protein
MLGRFPAEMLAQLKVAILESLDRQEVQLEPGTVITVSNPDLGQAEILLTEGA